MNKTFNALCGAFSRCLVSVAGKIDPSLTDVNSAISAAIKSNNRHQAMLQARPK